MNDDADLEDYRQGCLWRFLAWLIVCWAIVIVVAWAAWHVLRVLA